MATALSFFSAFSYISRQTLPPANRCSSNLPVTRKPSKSNYTTVAGILGAGLALTVVGPASAAVLPLSVSSVNPSTRYLCSPGLFMFPVLLSGLAVGLARAGLASRKLVDSSGAGIGRKGTNCDATLIAINSLSWH
ncbi:hypothetical protein P3X46_016613 [Hevea brasiliensis]|uniref:Uncharacterized protein n=1 Tax=Hevea brasiliensis TaxID=3981 RepID=A0ABQ9M1T3_HEVBR|nr:uncharacterized protein LOC131183233 [Hevea brasiliensis]KAJ9173490.1 hypothetical protein P3X46_016613 [Hevea brasiliensis]